MHTSTLTFLSYLPPFFWPTISLGAGIWLQSSAPGMAIIVSTIACIIILTGSAGNTQAKLPLVLAALVLGVATSFWQKAPLFAAMPPIEDSEIVGSISDYAHMPHARIKHRLTVQLSKQKINGFWKKNNHSIHLYTQQKPDALVGDTIHLEHTTVKQDSGTSFADYLLRNGISGTAFLVKLEPLSVFRPAWSFDRWLFTIRDNMTQAIRTKLSPQGYALFASLFLGERSSIKKELDPISADFKQWGLAHYLARSGLHLVLFVFLWVMMLNWSPLPFALKHWTLLLLTVLYFAFSWSSAPFLRAFFTLFLYKICIFANRPSHFLHILSLITFCFLLINPIQLFFLDFQLSFGLTAALAWFGLVQRSSLGVKKANP